MYSSIYPYIDLPIYLLFHPSIWCCNDAQLRCNTARIAVAPRCEGMLHRARRHRTTAPASSSPSDPMAEYSRVPPEYPAIEPPALRVPGARESAAARATPVQQREPGRTALRPTHPREYPSAEYPPSTGRWVPMERVGSTGVPTEYLKGAVRGSRGIPSPPVRAAAIVMQSHRQ